MESTAFSRAQLNGFLRALEEDDDMDLLSMLHLLQFPIHSILQEIRRHRDVNISPRLSDPRPFPQIVSVYPLHPCRDDKQ